METPEQRDQGNESGGTEGGAAGAPATGDESLDLGGGAAPGSSKDAGKGKGGKAARGEQQKAGDAPAWQKPDYTGALTIEQAEWRNTHLTQKRFQAK